MRSGPDVRDVLAFVVLGVLLGIAIASWASLLGPSEWGGYLWKNGYWPFTVELSVRDR